MARRPISRGGRGVLGYAPALVLALLIGAAAPAEAQSSRSLVEQMRTQRLKVRAVELIGTMGRAAAPRDPVELRPDSAHNPQRVFWWLPRSRAPEVAHGPLRPPPAPEPEPPPPALAEVRWKKVSPLNQAEFLGRFGEAVWTNDGMRGATPIDTVRTLELRGRLNYLYGTPTRTALARGPSETHGGSEFVQFEYWFVVNDTIPFVAMDVDGPFGRGLIFAGDLEHEALLGPLKADLVQRLLAVTRLMPFVDYYQSRDRAQWYTTGYDGERFYVEESRRPRWARRSRGREQWYTFR